MKKLKKRKVFSSFKDNICFVHLADVQLRSKYKRAKGITVTNSFQIILGKSNPKPKIYG